MFYPSGPRNEPGQVCLAVEPSLFVWLILIIYFLIFPINLYTWGVSREHPKYKGNCAYEWMWLGVSNVVGERGLNRSSRTKLAGMGWVAWWRREFSGKTDEIKIQYKFNSRHKSEPRQVCLAVEPGRDQLRCLRGLTWRWSSMMVAGKKMASNLELNGLVHRDNIWSWLICYCLLV